jgi:hypothetical protein
MMTSSRFQSYDSYYAKNIQKEKLKRKQIQDLSPFYVREMAMARRSTVRDIPELRVWVVMIGS